MSHHLRSDLSVEPVKTAVLHLLFKAAAGRRGQAEFAKSSLDEACSLAESIGLQVCYRACLRLDHPSPKTLLTSGALAEAVSTVTELQAGLVIVNHQLTPVQQRNLEQALATKVIDRTGLILEIFGARARSREGQLQVELAALTYQRSRLVRSWTHLERQRGGYGFLGGPGESQIELDRRLIGKRILTIKQALEKVRKRRKLQRSAREHQLVALVGYTNAGKSTLFNSLTNAVVASQNRLFVTLDPTTRALTLASGRKILISDTVGFVRDLPTQLVAAFRATLEEVITADLILHVRDISHPDTLHQRQAVEEVLQLLGIKRGDKRLFEVHNKSDLLGYYPTVNADRSVAISALRRCGLDALIELIERQLTDDQSPVSIWLERGNSQALSWLCRRARVLECHDECGLIHLKVILSPLEQSRFEKHYPRLPSSDLRPSATC